MAARADLGGTADAIREAVAELEDPRRIRAVAVTGMGMDGLPVDEQGQWLYPFISWHDPRTGPQHQWWQQHIGAEKVFSIGGNPLWPINSACESSGWRRTSRRFSGGPTSGC